MDKTIIGEKFGQLTVIAFSSVIKGKSHYTFKCDCGLTVTRAIGNIKSGGTRSCGCLKKKLVSERYTKHKDTGTRLYQCWKSMRVRAKSREGCKVFLPWDDFSVFKLWAESAGYKDTLVLCREGDIGDYRPDNVRWDTKRSNSREGTVCTWEVTTPEGVTVEVIDMVTYCEENNLCAFTMRGIARGKTRKHKGYTNVRKIT